MCSIGLRLGSDHAQLRRILLQAVLPSSKSDCTHFTGGPESSEPFITWTDVLPSGRRRHLVHSSVTLENEPISEVGLSLVVVAWDPIQAQVLHDSSPQGSIRIVDTVGRSVRRIAMEGGESLRRELRDALGLRVPPGLSHAVLESG